MLEVSGLKTKNDGNNVDMDREARLLAENALKFAVATNLARSELQTLRIAIEEGKTSVSLFSSLSVSASGMSAQRTRAELLVENLANADTTRTPEGGPYRRKDVVFAEDPSLGSFSFGTGLRARLASVRRHA